MSGESNEVDRLRSENRQLRELLAEARHTAEMYWHAVPDHAEAEWLENVRAAGDEEQ